MFYVGIFLGIEYCECWSCCMWCYLMFRQMQYICTCVSRSRSSHIIVKYVKLLQVIHTFLDSLPSIKCHTLHCLKTGVAVVLCHSFCVTVTCRAKESF